jgi:mannosyltransferase
MAAATLVIGARLRAQSLWIDEAITLVPVTQARDVTDLVTRVRAIDTQPPASHALLYALRARLPRDEFGWRLPSLLAVEAGVLLLALLGGRLYGPTGLFFTGLGAQLSPFLLFYAMEARNYALWFFAIAAAAWAMTGCLQAILARSPWSVAVPWGVAWALANALGLWTHLFHLFALLVQATIVAALGLLLRPRAG